MALLTTPATIARMERDQEPEIPLEWLEKIVLLSGYGSTGDFLAKCENYTVDLARNLLLVEELDQEDEAPESRSPASLEA